MNQSKIALTAEGRRRSPMRRLLLVTSALAPAMLVSGQAIAQDEQTSDEIFVTGIRASLADALNEKRAAPSLTEVIKAEDIGKLPDQNLAEVLENITGIQITREEGVGTGVQIRGTSDNRLEINGVSSVGAGNGRTGINFEDLNPAIIAGVEVIKAPTAKTIEGSIGGTINLKTIRPLALSKPLFSVRAEAEDSSLSTQGLQPRFSGAAGKKWETSSGQVFGIVLSGSYTESSNTSFRPRVDRDNLTTCPTADTPSSCPAGATHFLGVQFLNQVQRTESFETINLAGSLEYQPTDSLKLYADYIYTDQTRRRAGSRAQFSNVSRLNGDGQPGAADPATRDSNINFTDFETFDLGTDATGRDLGSVLAVTAGTFSPFQGTEPFDSRGAPFLRASSDNSSRLTESDVLIGGAQWEAGRLSIDAEYARVSSETLNPRLETTLNFINPNSATTSRDENGIPIIFDFSEGNSFAINFDDPRAPTVEQLLDPNNYVFDGSPGYSANIQENVENSFRLDASYDLADAGVSFLNSVDVGYRYSNRSALRDDRQASTSGSSSLANSLNAGAIGQLLTPIPDNFGDGTNSDLFVRDLLHVNPNISANPEQTIDTINAAAVAQGLSPIFSSELQSVDSAFFDITEETNTFYGQVNFEGGRLRGNAGLRYVRTSIESSANVVGAGDPVLTTDETSYDHFLPRVNLSLDATDDIVLRASYSRDIRRPDFEDISPSRTFPNAGGVNSNSMSGNPDLRPEEVDAFDVSASWYFAPEAVVSVGYFRKERGKLFGTMIDEPGGPGDPGVIAPNTRDTVGPVCEGGGIFSPGTEAGIFGDGELGVCVGDEFEFNSEGTTTQQGIELAFQYNLAAFEDRLGWASGFGATANYTHQWEQNNSGLTDIAGSRAQAIFAAQGFDPAVNPVQRETATLLGLSRNAFNVTGYYQKYGLSARLRYTWRSPFRTDDLPGTGRVFDPLGFRGVVEARGQLNGSVSYAVTDQFSVNVDAVNLTESSQNVFCVNNNALLCYEGITDRRIIFGARFTY